MNETFTSEFFAGNRAQLRQLFTGTAPIVLTGNGRMQQAATEAYPFHQDRNFWYLTGVDEPEVMLVMDRGREYLVLPTRSDVQTVFDGGYDVEGLRAISGVEAILTAKEGWKLLGDRLKRARHVATLAAAPKYIEVFSIYSNPARAELIAKMKECNPAIELLDMRPHFLSMRMVKQPIEIAALRQAIDITIDTVRGATGASSMSEYAFEYELEAELSRGFRKRSASGHAFPPIVAGGERACTLHYIANNHALSPHELVVVDVGAEYKHYAADITRTMPVGAPTKRQKQVHKAVLESVEYAFSLLKPGVVVPEYEKEMERFVGEKLRELGLIKSIDSASVRHYFPHATSHFLGLDTHDAGDYERPLEPGVILTVEPGIYIPEESIGVRIEDDVLITAAGIEVLSERLPRHIV